MFMRHDYRMAYTSALNKYWHKYTSSIQSAVRRYLARIHFRKVLKLILHIQFRMRYNIQFKRKLRKAAALKKIQSTGRMYLVRKKYKPVFTSAREQVKCVHAAAKVQSIFRMHLARNRYEYIIYMIIMIQANLRMKMRRARYLELYRINWLEHQRKKQIEEKARVEKYNGQFTHTQKAPLVFSDGNHVINSATASSVSVVNQSPGKSNVQFRIASTEISPCVAEDQDDVTNAVDSIRRIAAPSASSLYLPIDVPPLVELRRHASLTIGSRCLVLVRSKQFERMKTGFTKLQALFKGVYFRKHFTLSKKMSFLELFTSMCMPCQETCNCSC